MCGDNKNLNTYSVVEIRVTKKILRVELSLCKSLLCTSFCMYNHLCAQAPVGKSACVEASVCKGSCVSQHVTKSACGEKHMCA